MINVRQAIYNALNTAVGAQAGVYHFYPDKDAAYPAVSFYESANHASERADGSEYLTEVTYQADVWTRDLVSACDIAETVNTAFAGLGFRREMMNDIYDPNCKHITMRFRGLIDQSGTVYQ